MLTEKIAVDFDVFEGGPLLDVNGIGVEVVNLGALHCKQKRRMCRYYKLTATRPRTFFNVLSKSKLLLGRKAVFGFVEKVERVCLNLRLKIHQSRLAVGMFAHFARKTLLYELGFGNPLVWQVGEFDVFEVQRVVEIHATNAPLFGLVISLVVNIKKLLTAIVNFLINSPYI